jgi:hypothetical protein
MVHALNITAKGRMHRIDRGRLAFAGQSKFSESPLVSAASPPRPAPSSADGLTRNSVFKYDKSAPGGFKWGFELDDDPERICFAKLYAHNALELQTDCSFTFQDTWTPLRSKQRRHWLLFRPSSVVFLRIERLLMASVNSSQHFAMLPSIE